MKIIIFLCSLLLFLLSLFLDAKESEMTYLFFIFLGSLFSFSKFTINKVDITPYLTGVILGFVLNNLYLDHKGFNWVSNKDNWINTSVSGWLITFIIIVFITIIFNKKE